MPDETIVYDGYHGTNAESVESIQQNNFKESRGEHHWLGEGVYFFIEGISSSPFKDAKEWAIASAWNNDKKCHDYKRYAVLKAAIKFNQNELWDLTTDDGQKQFNYIRENYIRETIHNRLKKEGRRIRNEDNIDAAVIDHAKKTMGFKIIKADLYIKFTFERIQRIVSRFANTRVLAVSDPDNHIDKTSIELRFSGNVERR